MSAPTGNTNASRWTRQATIHMLHQIEAIALDEFSATHTLSQALLRVRCYKQLWSYWKKKWENDEEVMDQIYYIEQIFINKLEEGALFKQLHASACYFILRHNYGYNTKGESELPSHLRSEFEQPAQETPANKNSGSGSKSKNTDQQNHEDQHNTSAINEHTRHDFGSRTADTTSGAMLREPSRRHSYPYTAERAV